MLHTYLGNLRILDLSQYLPGPFAAQLLADMGGDVIKVEPPHGDPLWGLDPVHFEEDGGAYHAAVNGGKNLVRLDLKTAAGRAALESLIRDADGLLESFRPGVMQKLGFGPERLRSLNPSLVHCALSGFGQSGPLSMMAGHDMNFMALAGALSTSGTVARPALSWPPVADMASGMYAALSMMGAFFARVRTGEGAFLDLAMADAALAWQGWNQSAAASEQGEASRGETLLNGGAACYQIYETRDGRFVSLGAIEPKFWENFCKAADRPEWIAKRTNPMPQTALIDEVAALFRARTLEEWNAILAEVDCCYMPVLTHDEVAAHPHVAERGLVRRHAGPVPFAEVLFPALPEGERPESRSPVHELTVDEALARWSG